MKLPTLLLLYKTFNYLNLKSNKKHNLNKPASPLEVFVNKPEQEIIETKKSRPFDQISEDEFIDKSKNKKIKRNTIKLEL